MVSVTLNNTEYVVCQTDKGSMWKVTVAVPAGAASPDDWTADDIGLLQRGCGHMGSIWIRASSPSLAGTLNVKIWEKNTLLGLIPVTDRTLTFTGVPTPETRFDVQQTFFIDCHDAIRSPLPATMENFVSDAVGYTRYKIQMTLTYTAFSSGLEVVILFGDFYET